MSELASRTIAPLLLYVRWFQLLVAQLHTTRDQRRKQRTVWLCFTLVSCSISCLSPCVQKIKRKINPVKPLKVLWRLIFASSVWKEFLVRISNLKENITVSDSALFNHTGTKRSGRKVKSLQMPDVTEDI